MGLSLFKFVQCPVGSKRRIFSATECVLAVQGRSGSSEVGWFCYQSKGRIRLPISPSLWLWSYLAPFLRYGDLLDKNCLFFLPLPHSAPSLPIFPLEFTGEVNRQKTSHGAILHYSEDRMILAGVVLAWYQRVTDGRTVERTESIIANTALSPALHSKLCWLLMRCKKGKIGSGSAVWKRRMKNMQFSANKLPYRRNVVR